MSITFRPPSDAQSEGQRAGTGQTIDLVTMESRPVRRFPGDPYLARLRASAAEAARLRECLDHLPLATLIVDRSALNDLRTSFVSRAAALLLGIDGPLGADHPDGHGADGADLSASFGDGAEELVAALRELTAPRSFDSEITPRTADSAQARVPTIPVRVTLTVLEADLGDSILCTFAARA